MKAMSKSELAQAAGVSLSTLARWMKPYRRELEILGMTPGMRLLPPRVVKFLVEQFCIDVGASPQGRGL